MEACKELLWVKNFLQELDFVQDKSKHIDVRYHWIRDALDAKSLELTKGGQEESKEDVVRTIRDDN
ncbi:hypothetical protein CR513_51931, partial [Mucuna pruriens]